MWRQILFSFSLKYDDYCLFRWRCMLHMPWNFLHGVWMFPRKDARNKRSSIVRVCKEWRQPADPGAPRVCSQRYLCAVNEDVRRTLSLQMWLLWREAVYAWASWNYPRNARLYCYQETGVAFHQPTGYRKQVKKFFKPSQMLIYC